METLTSITEITSEDIIPTSNSPIKVEANDFNTYLCKHTSNTVANILFNEYLAAQFLRLWDIYLPPMVFLDIKMKHINVNVFTRGIQKSNFEKICIGFKYMNYAKNLDKLDAGIKNNKTRREKIKNKNDLLKIILFDIWLANEDRNQGNFNLLLNPEEEGYKIVPIDHEYIFNTNSLDKEGSPYSINQYDSIIASDFFKSLFPKHNKKKIVTFAEQISNNLSNYVINCKNNIENIINDVPTDWNIDTDFIKSKLHQRIFNPEWQHQTVKTFNEFIPIALK